MLNQLTISEFAAKLGKREVSATEIMRACLEQIQRVDGRVHAPSLGGNVMRRHQQ